MTKPDGGLRPRLRSSWVYRTPSEDGLTLIKGLEPLRELFEPTASKLRAHVVGLGATISVGVDLKVAVDDAWAAISVVLSPPDLRFLDSLHANFVVNALMPGHIDRVE
ncbi:MAG TPA: hypothetical protein VHB69_14080 [Mycobacteriales bacterium]|nr:hypothetical protein [Mycobacteriales bacterium]